MHIATKSVHCDHVTSNEPISSTFLYHPFFADIGEIGIYNLHFYINVNELKIRLDPSKWAAETYVWVEGPEVAFSLLYKHLFHSAESASQPQE